MKMEIKVDEETIRNLVLAHIKERFGREVVEGSSLIIESCEHHKSNWEQSVSIRAVLVKEDLDLI